MEHRVHQRDGVTVVAFEGEIDLEVSPRARDLLLDLLVRTFQFHQQHRGRLLRIPGRHGPLSGLDRQLVHDLHGAGQQSRPDDQGHRVAGGTYFVRLDAGGETVTRKVVSLGD